MHGDDDQIVPIGDSAPLSAKLLKKGSLKVYEKYPHGMCTTHADVINAALPAFIKGCRSRVSAGGPGGPRARLLSAMSASGLSIGSTHARPVSAAAFPPRDPYHHHGV